MQDGMSWALTYWFFCSLTKTTKPCFMYCVPKCGLILGIVVWWCLDEKKYMVPHLLIFQPSLLITTYYFFLLGTSMVWTSWIPLTSLELVLNFLFFKDLWTFRCWNLYLITRIWPKVDLWFTWISVLVIKWVSKMWFIVL